MKKYFIITALIAISFLFINFIDAADNLAQKLSGRILLQVQSHGEAWYVNPTDYKKYYLGRPSDAFDLMRDLGAGITNEDLNKIKVGFITYDDRDDDSDGLTNRFEQAIGTDPREIDTDNDGYNDNLEIENNYNPIGNGTMLIDENFASQHIGRIFLQVEQAGEAWYISPSDKKRYYLGRPADAFAIMRELSLGITSESLIDIATGSISAPTPTPPSPIPPSESDQIFSAAAAAIRTGDKTKAVSYFIPEMQKAIEYTMDFLDSEGKLTLGNIMSGAKLSESTDTKKTYSTEVYFSLGGYKVPVNFNVEKQEDETWKLTNL